MSLLFLPDTNVIIGLIKGNANIIKRIQRYEASAFALSAIVLQELYFGASKSSATYREGNFRNIAHLPFAELAFDAQDARMAGEIRATLKTQGTPIGPYDTLIAAQALARNLTLITHNTREFARVEGLRVEDWL